MLLGEGFSLLISVIGAVEGGETFEIVGVPSMLSLQELVDFSLRARSLADSG